MIPSNVTFVEAELDLIERLKAIERDATGAGPLITLLGESMSSLQGGPAIPDWDTFIRAMESIGEAVGCKCEDEISSYLAAHNGVWPSTDGSKVLARMRRAYSATCQEYVENGFVSEQVMTNAHEPLVRAVSETASGGSGHIIDFGCGTGVLLEKITRKCPLLIPVGVESDPIRAAYARRRLHAFCGVVHQTDMFAGDLWRRCSVPTRCAVFSVQRLMERNDSEAQTFIQDCIERCAVVIPYIYGHGKAVFSAVCDRLGLRGGEMYESEHCNAQVLCRNEQRKF